MWSNSLFLSVVKIKGETDINMGNATCVFVVHCEKKFKKKIICYILYSIGITPYFNAFLASASFVSFESRCSLLTFIKQAAEMSTPGTTSGVDLFYRLGIIGVTTGSLPLS